MEMARDGAWRFACELAAAPEEEWPAIIQTRDLKIAQKGNLVTSPGWAASTAFKVVRLGERGSIADKVLSLTS